MQTGGAQAHIHPRDLNPMKIIVPSKGSERKYISNIFSGMDTEIKLLKIFHLKSQKITYLCVLIRLVISHHNYTHYTNNS